MATGPPTGADGAQTADQPTPPQSENSVTWDGDKMFNIYIYDYCQKRGYNETAKALKHEANVADDAFPPINAKQGLLFEWWSVFWVLFSAKSSGQGSEDALLYTQHQSYLQQQKQNPNQAPQAPRGPPHPQQVQGRLVNGAIRPGGQPGMPNGVHPNVMPGQPPHMPNGMPNQYPGGMPHANGITGPPAPNGPTIGTPAQPMIPGQPRPGGAPQRAMPNGAPFRSSPTMAPSPQHQGMQPGQQQMGGPSGQQPMNRGPMPPPNGQPGMPGAHMAGTPQMPPGTFPQLANPASQPNSPASHGMPHPSPSMAARQPPRGPEMRQMQVGGGPEIRQLQESSINAELLRIETSKLPELKQEAGLGNKDLPSFTLEDKQRVIGLAKARGILSVNARPPAPNATAGPSNPQQNMFPPNQQRAIGSSPQTHPGQIPRNPKRSSTSPGEDGDQPQTNESSPPVKKQRTTPTGPDQLSQPPMAPMVPYPGRMATQMHAQNTGLMPRPGMPGGQVPFTHMPQGPGAMGMPMGAAQAAHMQNPMMAHQPLTPQMAQYRETMQSLHRVPMMQGNASSPGSADSPYNTDGSNPSRPGSQFGVPGAPGPNRGPMPPQANKMMPPPSPSVNAAKNAQPKQEGQDGNSLVGSSPRNAAMQPQQPPQPPQPQPQPQPQGQPGPGGPGGGPMNAGMGGGTAPPTPGGTPMNPGQGPPPQQQQPPPPPQDMFSTDLMGPTFTFDGLETSMFGGDGGLGGLGGEFPADFSEWFNDTTLMNETLK